MKKSLMLSISSSHPHCLEHYANVHIDATGFIAAQFLRRRTEFLRRIQRTAIAMFLNFIVFLIFASLYETSMHHFFYLSLLSSTTQNLVSTSIILSIKVSVSSSQSSSKPHSSSFSQRKKPLVLSNLSCVTRVRPSAATADIAGVELVTMKAGRLQGWGWRWGWRWRW